jgi:hypothetical protein
MSTSLSDSFQLEIAGNSESGSTIASALALGPLVAVSICAFFTSRELGISMGLLLTIYYNQKQNRNIELEEVIPVQQICSRRSYLQALER